jgi:hypothetical protein
MEPTDYNFKNRHWKFVKCFSGFLFFLFLSQAGSAKERLPVYHETGSKKIYEAQLTASDWTAVSPVSEDRKLR